MCVNVHGFRPVNKVSIKLILVQWHEISWKLWSDVISIMSCSPIKLTQTTNINRACRWIIETLHARRTYRQSNLHTPYSIQYHYYYYGYYYDFRSIEYDRRIVHMEIRTPCTWAKSFNWKIDGLELLCADTQKKAIRQERKTKNRNHFLHWSHSFQSIRSTLYFIDKVFFCSFVPILIVCAMYVVRTFAYSLSDSVPLRLRRILYVRSVPFPFGN